MAQETTDEKSDAERDVRITFQEGSLRERAGATDVPPDRRRSRRSLSSSRSRARTRSRHSSREELPQPSPYSGVQIEHRTLSIHVSESHQAQAAAAEIELKHDSDDSKKDKDNKDYFVGLTYHELEKDQLCQHLNVSETQGLSEDAAAIRLKRDGKNTLPQPRTNYFKKLFWYTFGGFCSVLWVGVIVFFLCWQPLSSPPSASNLALAILILIVIFLQATFSAFQDWSASHTMKSVLELIPANTNLLREGRSISLPSTELVAGDVVHLTMGNKVPADMRLIDHSGDIRFDRSMLTGESEEIEGAVDATDSRFLESRNIALMGTMVVNGSGVGVVVLTGHRSVMGRIAKVMGDVKEKPALIQREITRFMQIVVSLTVCLVLLIVFAWTGWLRVDHPGFMSVVGMLTAC